MAELDSDRPAKGHEVREILGPLDDPVVTAILGVGATPSEVMEAYAWLSADDQLRRERHRTISGRAAQVWRILEAELPPSRDEP
jgi:hypothetical protein